MGLSFLNREKNETGKLIGHATCELLDEWHRSDGVKAMLLDTTAANTTIDVATGLIDTVTSVHVFTISDDQ